VCDWSTAEWDKKCLSWAFITTAVFWVVTLCGRVAGYQAFGGVCRLHLQGKMIDNRLQDYMASQSRMS
jgi:hypothetical protein